MRTARIIQGIVVAALLATAACGGTRSTVEPDDDLVHLTDCVAFVDGERLEYSVAEYVDGEVWIECAVSEERFLPRQYSVIVEDIADPDSRICHATDDPEFGWWTFELIGEGRAIATYYDGQSDLDGTVYTFDHDSECL